MQMMIIDGTQVLNMAQVHECFVAALSFPEWYGHNLDALHDCLTDVSEPLVIRVAHCAILKERLGSASQRLFRVLEESAIENPLISVEFVS